MLTEEIKALIRADLNIRLRYRQLTLPQIAKVLETDPNTAILQLNKRAPVELDQWKALIAFLEPNASAEYLSRKENQLALLAWLNQTSETLTSNDPLPVEQIIQHLAPQEMIDLKSSLTTYEWVWVMEQHLKVLTKILIHLE